MEIEIELEIGEDANQFLHPVASHLVMQGLQTEGVPSQRGTRIREVPRKNKKMMVKVKVMVMVRRDLMGVVMIKT